MCYEPIDYNNEEPLREHIEWCQKLLELISKMVDVAYVNMLVSIYIWHFDLEGLLNDKDANKFVQLKSLEVAVGREGVIAHDVTLGAYNTNKFFKFF
jgi:hypothetical protein